MDNMTESSHFSSWRDYSLIRRIRLFVPVGFKEELKELAKLSVPVVLSNLMIYFVSFISTVFCGHLGKTELAGVALATAVINVTGVSIGVGLASACDTLISQTFGAGNLQKVGVILQRGILILLLACFPCWAILVNTEVILLAVKQDPQVAKVSQMYVKIFMPGLPASFMFALQARYLQNQNIIWPQVITGFVVNLLNALINYIVLFVLHQGVAGSALANTISQFAMAITLFIYIKWKGLHKSTWRGWSRACLEEWGSFVRLAIPSMLMMCIEWWTYEIGSFLAGLISEVELGAQSVVYELSNIAFMFPLSFSVAGNVRVGNALGAGQTDRAKVSAKLSMFCAVSVSVCFAILIGSLKDYVAYIFTNDEQIRQKVSVVLGFYAPFFLLDALAVSSGGIIRGAGKQKIGAICNFVGYYCVGLPIGVSLMFAAKLGIVGLWIGLLVCGLTQSTFMIVYLARMNWNTATIEAKIRAGVSGDTIDTDYPAEASRNSDTNGLVDMSEEPAVSVEQAGMPLRTLVLRRVLILAVMMCILALGIILSYSLPGLVT